MALASRLLLILDFDMEFFRSHKRHTGSNSCPSIPLSLFPPVSLWRFPPASLYFVIVAWCRCSPLSLGVVFLPFLHLLHASFVALLPFSFLFHNTAVTCMHANYYPPSYIQENRLPFNLHGRSMSPKIVFTFVVETGFEVDVVLVCVCFGGVEKSSKTSNI